MTDKTPSTLIDEEESKQNGDIVDGKTGPPPPPPSDNVEDEKERNSLRCHIDILTYKSRLDSLDEKLRMERVKELLRLEDEIHQERLKIEKHDYKNKLEIITSKLDLRQKNIEWNSWTDSNTIQYLTNPVIQSNNGSNELVLSDRIINIPEVITFETGEYIYDRIQYFNNKSDQYPIFLIIDYCRGGSLMAGHQILTAINSSQVEVYVLVKSFAASMAAAITTLAPKSLVYPNAIILHHQIWYRNPNAHNVSQSRDELKQFEEAWKRFAEPIVKKLGTTLDQWIKDMYANSVNGDWKLYGDQAVAKGWAWKIVNKVRETSVIRHPDKVVKPNNLILRLFGTKRNRDGSRRDSHQDGMDSSVLPVLRPLDYYWLYNAEK